MRSRFSKSNPPECVKYMGKKYRLKKGAIPARSAEQKIKHVSQALGRLEYLGYPAKPVATLTNTWTIDRKNLLNSTDVDGKHPSLIMWNPLTTELILAADDDVTMHVYLYDTYKPHMRSYVGDSYDDWVRAYVDDRFTNKLYVHDWEPILLYWPYLDMSQRRDAERLHKQGMKAFARMLEVNGVNIGKLRQAAMPAKAAEQKLRQVESAMIRVQQQGYPAKPTPMIAKKWTMNPNDILASTDSEGSTPLLIMWNPITAELLLTSEEDVNAPLHTMLHRRHRNDIIEYADSGYDDWVRGVYSKDSNEVAVYKWGPLLKYMMFMDDRERRYADKLQKEGNEAFKRMLEMNGAASHRVRMKSSST